jgi:hypothetical protein
MLVSRRCIFLDHDGLRTGTESFTETIANGRQLLSSEEFGIRGFL